MDDERTVAGMPQLDRQERPVRVDRSGRPLVPARVPETRPTPLGELFIHLSIVVLACGVIAISALELGTPLGAPIVRVPVLIGCSVLLLVTVDAVVRIARSAAAWWAVDRGRALFRTLWVGVLAATLPLIGLAAWAVLTA